MPMVGLPSHFPRATFFERNVAWGNKTVQITRMMIVLMNNTFIEGRKYLVFPSISLCIGSSYVVFRKKSTKKPLTPNYRRGKT